MIRLVFENVKWGLAAIPSDGIQLDLYHEDAEIWAHVPFADEPLIELVAGFYGLLNEDQKRAVRERIDQEGEDEGNA